MVTILCLLQRHVHQKLLASPDGRVLITVPRTLLCAAIGSNWEQAGFQVQLSVFKDSIRMAGRRLAARQGPCATQQS
jgi:hypothetical protein